MRKNDMPLFIAILRHDAFVKMKNYEMEEKEYIPNYNIQKFWQKTINIYGVIFKFA